MTAPSRVRLEFVDPGARVVHAVPMGAAVGWLNVLGEIDRTTARATLFEIPRCPWHLALSWSAPPLRLVRLIVWPPCRGVSKSIGALFVGRPEGGMPEEEWRAAMAGALQLRRELS